MGHRAPRREATWLAAVPACGDGAVLSHHSAAVLWELSERDAPRPHVTVPRDRRPPGIVTHQARLLPAEMTVRHGIPVTSPARTLVDLARVLTPVRFERAIREAQFRHRFQPAALAEALARRPSRALRAKLGDIAPTQSGTEDIVLRICDRHAIPRPRTQQWIGVHRMDFFWPDQRLVVEADGWDAHRTPAAFQADRATGNELLLAGYALLRFTRADLLLRPDQVARQIRAALARGAGG